MVSLESCRSELTSLLQYSSIWVAYSGGLDSQVLLYLAKQILPPAKLKAIHINHGLHDQADQWAQYCTQCAKRYQIECIIEKIHLTQLPQESLEAQARKARLTIFQQYLQENDVLLTAHHANDQAETVLMRCLRGSGVDGLGGIRRQRQIGKLQIVSPLLSYTRDELHQFAQQQQLQWVEDPSNLDTHFSRNFLRQNVLPVLKQHFPAVEKNLSRSAKLAQDASHCLRDLALLDSAQNHFYYRLPIVVLDGLSPSRAANVLRQWIIALGLHPPNEEKIELIFSQVIAAKADSQPLLRWPGAHIRRFQGELYALRQDPEALHPPQMSIDRLPFLAEENVGRIRLEQQPKGEIDPHKITAKQLKIRFRQGGECMRLKPQGANHRLKQLFQQYHVPPWERRLTPLLYADEKLVAVANHWVAAEFQAQSTDSGWKFQWQNSLYPQINPEQDGD